MKIIKVSAGPYKDNKLLLRQFPEMSGIWGDCKFIINSDIDKCDWWFVMHGSGVVKTEECLCDPSHIVYISMEPSEVMSRVSNDFINQFSHLVLCDRNITHPSITYMNWLTWWVGVVIVKSKKSFVYKNQNLNYDDFTDMKPIDKMNKLSIIMSKKNFSEGHEKRINFIDKLINSPIAKYIDIYGDGYTPIPDKWDGIAQYKYHLVIENSSIKDYWSEKLADSFLGFSLPIYYGCPNIFDYFSKDSIILIDIDNIEKSIRTIKNVIEENLYDDHVRSINIARNQVLNEYNIFNLMAQMSLVKGSNFKNVKLRTNYYFSDSWIKKIARYVINKMSL